MQDAWRAYLQLALGLTEASKKRAQKVAKKLAGTSGATAGQLQAFVEELSATGSANREALTKLIRFEVDRTLAAVGLATKEEVADLTARVRELENDLQEARAGAGTVTGPSDGTAATRAADLMPETATTAAPRPAVAKKAVAKKAVAKKAVAQKVTRTAAGSAVTQATSGQVVATTSPVKKAVAKKAVAQKAIAKKAVAKKAVARKTGGLALPGPATQTPEDRR